MILVNVSGDGEVKGFVRDVREDIIMKAMDLSFSFGHSGMVVEINRTMIESWIKDAIKTVGEDHDKIVKIVFGRLKEKYIS